MDKTRNLSQAKRRLFGVVLCGGRSARMGRNKAGLPHPCGGTFLQSAIGRLNFVCDAVGVSTSPGQSNDGLHNVSQIIDPVSYQGPMIGVATCLAHAQRLDFDGCLFIPVDMPDLSTDDLQRLRDAWANSSNQLVCAVDSVSGHPEPLVAIYPTCFAKDLCEAATSVDRSLYRWMQGRSPIQIPLSPGSSRNVNQPDDLSP